MIIIPIKWLFHWEYTLFSDKPIYTIVIHFFWEWSIRLFIRLQGLWYTVCQWSQRQDQRWIALRLLLFMTLQTTWCSSEIHVCWCSPFAWKCRWYRWTPASRGWEASLRTAFPALACRYPWKAFGSGMFVSWLHHDPSSCTSSFIHRLPVTEMSMGGDSCDNVRPKLGVFQETGRHRRHCHDWGRAWRCEVPSKLEFPNLDPTITQNGSNLNSKVKLSNRTWFNLKFNS